MEEKSKDKQFQKQKLNKISYANHIKNTHRLANQTKDGHQKNTSSNLSNNINNCKTLVNEINKVNTYTKPSKKYFISQKNINHKIFGLNNKQDEAILKTIKKDKINKNGNESENFYLSDNFNSGQDTTKN